jgi:hypothetical protein
MKELLQVSKAVHSDDFKTLKFMVFEGIIFKMVTWQYRLWFADKTSLFPSELQFI